MNKQSILALGAILCISSCLMASAVAYAENVDTRALITVEDYLDALVSADMVGMKNLLSPSLLEKKAPVLDSPSYGDMLRSRYENATFQIVGTSSVGDDRLKVDTEIALDSGRLMKASFVLVNDANGNYLIDEEVE